MPFKCHSKQIYTERYDYTLAAGENTLLPIKARRNEVIIVQSISVYNSSASKYSRLYKILKRRGIVCRLDYLNELDDPRVYLFNHELYLVDGDEAGIALTPSAAGDTVEVTIQCIGLRDVEFYKST